MRYIGGVAAVVLAIPSAHAAEADPRLAAFDFEFVNTSPAPTTPEESDRLKRLDSQLKLGLAEVGRYAVVDTAPVHDKLATEPSFRSCNGCELDLARDLGATYVAFGWVQKVSNLILNINLEIKDVASGKVVRADSVDLRGNTDESWQRGLRYLLNERLFRKS